MTSGAPSTQVPLSPNDSELHFLTDEKGTRPVISQPSGASNASEIASSVLLLEAASMPKPPRTNAGSIDV